MKPLKRKVSVTLDENVIEQLKAISEECDRSLSQVINLILKNYLYSVSGDHQSLL